MKCCDSKNIINEKEMYLCINCVKCIYVQIVCTNSWIFLDRI